MSRTIFNPASRYILGFIVVVLGIHLLLSSTSFLPTVLHIHNHQLHLGNSVGNASDMLGTDLIDLEHLQDESNIDPESTSMATEPSVLPPTKANATFVMLCRESDLEAAVKSMRAVEDRFNGRHNYPWVFLSEVPFSEEFKTRVRIITLSPVEFGVIPRDHWFQPDTIDEERAAAGRKELVGHQVPYGGSVPYRNMCRFNSGFFFRHPLMLKYRYYWRVEPSVQFHCNINQDPFMFMEESDKSYGFTISLPEYMKTIPTLWHHVQAFALKHPEYIPENNAMGFLTNPDGSYNGCHFWSNFEVADMDFWRSPAYMAFFEYLDAQGGFYYERWGDAPVHSIAAALLLDRSKIHFFDNIGYEHAPFSHCPILENHWEEGRCTCNPNKSFASDSYSCTGRFRKFMAPKDTEDKSKNNATS